jgi:hypothetical protein
MKSLFCYSTHTFLYFFNKKKGDLCVQKSPYPKYLGSKLKTISRQQAIKAYEGVEIKLSTIYTFALNAGKWSAII